MKEVMEESIRLMEKGEPCVLATVVRTKGMTPQKAGAKQLIRQDGSRVGTLGGGCLEGDIWFLAKQMLKEKSGPRFREYYLNEDVAARDGLVCGGTMYFYVEPLYPGSDFLPVAKEIVRAYEGQPSLALATVLASKQPEEPIGKRVLIREDGSSQGALNDEKLQAQVIRIGRKIAPFATKEYLAGENDTEVYIEGFTTPPTLVIMGGGHVGRAVYEVAVPLGFRVVIVDDRPEFSSKKRFPLAVETVICDFDKALDQVSVNLNSFLLVATRGHRFDDQATKAAIRTPARYIGLLGSRRKNLLIFRELRNEGIAIDRIREIHAPVGLDIGALTPEELAISIMAEIIMVVRGGRGGALKMDSENLQESIDNVPKPKKAPLPF